METFAKFKDWILNFVAIAILGGLISIKNDLTSIKEELPLYRYRIEQLETFRKESEKRQDDSEKELARINAALLPTKIELKKKNDAE